MCRRRCDLEHVEWVLQADQLGTGHAVMQAMSVIPDDHTVLVLYGDVPLIGTASLKKLIAIADAGALAILSVKLDEVTGYGRIVRNANGHVRAIVEHQDADAEQPQIREANSGLMAAPATRLREWLLGLGRNNAQREYYLTDVVAGAARAGAPRRGGARGERGGGHGRQRQDAACASRGLLPAASGRES